MLIVQVLDVYFPSLTRKVVCQEAGDPLTDGSGDGEFQFILKSVRDLKHEGTSHSSSDLLKIFVKMGASWSALDFRQTGDTPSGPGAFLILFSLKTCRTSSSLIFSVGVGEKGVDEGVNGCVERYSGRVQDVFSNQMSFIPFHTEAESLKDSLFLSLPE